MSLRKRPDGSKAAQRAQGAKPRPQQRLEKGGGNAPKSRVDDRIKKRMTMRYADISEPSHLSIPNMPSLPANPLPGTSVRGRDEQLFVESPTKQEDPRRADIKAMELENFDPEACKCVLVALLGISSRIFYLLRFEGQISQFNRGRTERPAVIAEGIQGCCSL